jgi:hypothetical protein
MVCTESETWYPICPSFRHWRAPVPVILVNPLNAELNPICHFPILLGDLTFMGTCIVSIFQYISNKIQRYTVYLYLETALTRFGWYFHPSSGAHTTVSIASGICHTVTAICHYRRRVGTGLSVLWVAYATHSTLKPVWQIPDVVDIAVCAADDGWKYHPKRVRAVSRYK